MLQAFDVLPEMKMTPHQAWQRQIKGRSRNHRTGESGGAYFGKHDPAVSAWRAATDAGEMITEESRAVLDFLLMLCSIGRHYPGFEPTSTGPNVMRRRLPCTSLKKN